MVSDMRLAGCGLAEVLAPVVGPCQEIFPNNGIRDSGRPGRLWVGFELNALERLMAPWYRDAMNVAMRKSMTLAEFLDWEERQDARYEFDGFEPEAMTGGTVAHDRITFNLQKALDARLA